MTRRKGYLTKREAEIVRRFKGGEQLESIVFGMWLGCRAGMVAASRFVNNALRRALTHQRVTDHGYVYYDKPARRTKP